MRFRPAVEELENRLVPSHFRFANLSWDALSGNDIEFHFQQTWRRSAFSFSGVGSVVTTSTLNFGDDSSTDVRLRVLSIDTSQDLFVGELVHSVAGGGFEEGFVHTYAAPGTYTAFMDSCCRISTLQNDRDGSFRSETLVNVGSGRSSPVSSLPPIVQVAANSIVQFQIPAADRNGDPLTFRLATAREAAGDFAFNGYVHPPGLSVSSSGLITWDIGESVQPQVRVGQLWTTQVIVEARDGSGNVISKIPLDFLLKVVSSTSPPPTFDIIPTAPINVLAGGTASFTVQASDANQADHVELVALNPPHGMTFTPIGEEGTENPVALRAVWTPTVDQRGQTFLVTFQATDETTGLATTATVTINTLTVSNVQADLIDAFDAKPVQPGQTTLATVGNATVALHHDAAASGTALLFFARYKSNPTGRSFGDQELANYDIQVLNADSKDLLLAFLPYTATTKQVRLGFFDPVVGRWQAVMGSTLVPNSLINDTQQAVFRVVFDATSTPRLPNGFLNTVFSITLSNAVATTTVITPPTASTTSTPTGSAVNFTSTTQLSLALTAAPTSRASAGGIGPNGASSDGSTAAVASSSQTTSTNSASNASSTTSLSGGGSDDAASRRGLQLTNDEIFFIWQMLEHTGQFPVDLPLPRPPEGKPANESPMQNEEGARGDAVEPPVVEAVVEENILPSKTLDAASESTPTPPVERPALRISASAGLVALLGTVPWHEWSLRKQKDRRPKSSQKQTPARGRSLGVMELPTR